VKTVHGLILDRIEGGRKAAASSISIPVRLQPGYEEPAAGQLRRRWLWFWFLKTAKSFRLESGYVPNFLGGQIFGTTWAVRARLLVPPRIWRVDDFGHAIAVFTPRFVDGVTSRLAHWSGML
jgi:hypothetical protein